MNENKFERLGLCQDLLRAIPFDSPTEIQEKSIPPILERKDVIAGSATGSGKTLAFAAGIIQNSSRDSGVQAIVLVPTRELAQQVAEEFNEFSKYKPLKVVCVYGGVGLGPQVDALRTAEAVVGTPGRVLDLLERNAFRLNLVKCLVLDEADRMLDMGFIQDVRKIMRQCPNSRQTLLFSATITRQIADLAQDFMHGPVHVSVQNFVDPTKLKQIYYDVIDDKLKFSLLLHFLKSERGGLAMVFCNTQSTTDFVSRQLQKNGIDALAIHGGFSQAKRNQTMERFHDNKFHVLVCTDVAARGLDISGISHVYNYDIPKDSKSYVHRIGRTARAGKEGLAISIIGQRDHEAFSAVMRINDTKIERGELPQFEKIRFQHSQSHSFEGGGRGGDRGRQGGFHSHSRGPNRGPSRGFGSSGGRRHEGGPRREGQGSPREGRNERREGSSEGREGRQGGRGFGDRPRPRTSGGGGYRGGQGKGPRRFQQRRD
ncbi:DEAD/DEAH box helicase [Candidatus Woesearchaeota archaeon]|nr:DEAD/DEAH box helicase [Candidatus Woesearchaeota archaeon]